MLHRRRLLSALHARIDEEEEEDDDEAKKRARSQSCRTSVFLSLCARSLVVRCTALFFLYIRIYKRERERERGERTRSFAGSARIFATSSLSLARWLSRSFLFRSFVAAAVAEEKERIERTEGSASRRERERGDRIFEGVCRIRIRLLVQCPHDFYIYVYTWLLAGIFLNE